MRPNGKNEDLNFLTCFENIADSVSDAIAITLASGQLVYQNDGLKELTGKDKVSKVSDFFSDKLMYEEILHLLQNGQEWSGEIIIINSLQENKKVNLKAFSVPDEKSGEKYFFWICFMTVLTKYTEEQLELLKHGIDHAEIGIFQIDDYGKIVYANHYACNMLGYTFDEITSIELFDIDPYIEKEKFLQYRTGMDSKSSFTSEGRHRRKDGSTFPVEVTVNMRRLGERGITMSFSKDISAQKEAEKQLNKKKYQLDTLMKMEQLGNWEYDFLKKEFLFNDNVFSIFKTSSDKYGSYSISLDKYIEEFVHSKDRQIVISEINKAIETKDPAYKRKFEHKIIYNNGKTGFITVSFYIEKDENGNTIKAFGVNQDNTERKRIENDLIVAKEKAEESDRFKSAFLANMSHEIRTPMNGILGFADLIKQKEVSELQKKKYIDIIKKSGKRMLSLINDLIDISRIESGQVEVNYRKADLDGICGYLYDFFKPEAEKKSIMLSLNKDTLGSAIDMKTDVDKLEQIFTNLIKNALKYTYEGYIDFGYYLKGEPASVPDDKIYFYVKDTGVGIKENLRTKIFERFNQGDAFRYKEIEGAGLGLAITKAYIELLGGEIWVEPNNEKGSVFNFTLPIKANTI